MDFMWPELLIFALKAVIFTVAFIMAIVVPVTMIKQAGPKKESQILSIKNLKDKYDQYILKFNSETLSKKDFKAYLKSIKKEEKLDKKEEKLNKQKEKATSYVLSFNGDMMATPVASLRQEITLLLQVAKPKDEVILLLESGGGSVAHYGLAASQLQRLRDQNLKLTVCVDRVAGSGGYLMACVGDQIISAPFAWIGSIGVLSTIPNVHDFLKKHDITFEEVTAGKYKRTITPFGKITEEKREKLQEDLRLVHEQFKSFVGKYRSSVDLEEVATGEVWLGQQAIKKGLVDKIQSSDDYIMEQLKTNDIYQVSIRSKKTLLDKLSKKVETTNQSLKNKLTEQWNEKSLPLFF